MQVACAIILPTFGNQPTDGGRYALRMPRSGKEIAPELLDAHAEDVIAIAQANLKACFAMAKRDARMGDRTNSNQLAAHLAAHKYHYGDTISKSHIYRMERAVGPVGTDVLHVIAKAYGLQAWHMLMAGLQPANPPVGVIDARQQAMFAGIEDSMRALREAPDAEKGTARNADQDRNTASATSGSGDARRGRAQGKAAAPAKKRRAKA